MVLVFQSMRLKSGRDMLAGVYSAARELGWQVQVFEEIPASRRLRELLAAWHPLGCLVANAVAGNRRPSFGKVPVVYFGRHPGTVFKVEQDAAATVRLVMDELARLHPSAYGYVCPAQDLPWSRIRRACFLAESAARAVPARVFDWTGLSPDTPAAQAAFRRWIAALPRPAGVFIAADYLAGPVLAAARHERLRIPEEMSFVSVDNDALICENLSPALSSVQPDHEGAGALLVHLLRDRLAHPRLAPCVRTFGPRELVRRESSLTGYGTVRVAQALAFIRNHLAEDISVDDVAASLRCGRRYAERLFRKETGRTILDAIRDARFEKVFSLLRSRCPLTGLAHACGYATDAYLKTLFRRRTGMTMTAWLQKNVPS